MGRGLVLGAMLVLLVGAPAAARTGGHAARVRTLAATRGQISAIAADGRRIAWIKTFAPCGRQIQVLTLPSRHPVGVGLGRGSCGSLGSLDSIAIAGRRVLWQALAAAGNTELDLDWLTATLGRRRARIVMHRSMERDTSDPSFDYEPPLPAAGDGRILAFYSLCNFEGCRDESAVRRFVGRRTRKVANVFEPIGLAVSGRRLAYMTNNRLCCSQDPRFSADGRQIAWSKSGDIWVIGADGTGERQLTSLPRYARHPAWSPDGRQIVFDFDVSLGGDGVEIVNADGTALRVLSASGTSPEWAPDGTKIAFIRANDVYVINPDGSGERKVTPTTTPTVGPLSWSPDSTRIAVSRGGDVYSVKADGSGETRLTTNAAVEGQPTWSPNGTKLAYVTDVASSASGIYVVNADGSASARLTSSSDVSPAWSPDSGRIAFNRGVDELWVMNADGSGQRRLAPSVTAATPRWSPDGSSIVVGDDPELEASADPSVRLVSPVDGTTRRIAPIRRSPIEIRNAVTGVRIARFTITGHAYSIALGRDYVALLVDHAPGVRVELYNLNGGFRKAAAVPSSARGLSAAGRNVVFATGKIIRRLDARIGVVRRLAKARGIPIGPTIEGRRVAWAENIRGNARIRATTVP
jgi:TolB protein